MLAMSLARWAPHNPGRMGCAPDYKQKRKKQELKILAGNKFFIFSVRNATRSWRAQRSKLNAQKMVVDKSGSYIDSQSAVSTSGGAEDCLLHSALLVKKLKGHFLIGRKNARKQVVSSIKKHKLRR